VSVMARVDEWLPTGVTPGLQNPAYKSALPLLPIADNWLLESYAMH